MLKVGFSRVDITPPLGTFVSGYFEERYADGFIDPIELNALALESGEERLLLITADLLGIREKYSTRIRELIAQRTGIAADHIMIASLHQHTSICLRDSVNNNVMEDHTYLDLLYRKFADVSQMALADLTEAEMKYGEQETEQPLSFVRRYRMSDGSVATNPKPNTDSGWPPIEPAEPADNTVRLLQFLRTDGKTVALVNFSTHPDVVKGTKFSADWPGYVRRFVEAEHENTQCLLLNGCQGDSNHKNYLLPAEERIYGGDTLLHAEYMGRTIANAVNALWNTATEKNAQAINAGVTTVYNKTRTDKEEFFNECWELYEAYMLKNDHSTRETTSGISLAEACRVVRLRTEAPLYQSIPVTVLQVGEIAFVGFGGEPFTHYATAVRERFPNKTVIAACCANGFQGYLPTATAFKEGGYEAVSSPFSPSLEVDCVNAACELLQKMNF